MARVQDWALVLGGSSGFGLASAERLARNCGLNLFIVHRDRRSALPEIEAAFAKIRDSHGVELVSFNTTALSAEGRQQILSGVADRLERGGKIRVLLHSVAFGSLKPVVKPAPHSAGALQALAQALGCDANAMQDAASKLFNDGHFEFADLVPDTSREIADTISEDDVAQTVYNMGTSLLTWVQELHARGMFASDARVLGFTSEGNDVAWRGYAAVAAAKVALESVGRAIAKEFAPYGIRCNIIQPGVTETRALSLIPGAAHLKAAALRRNPCGRLTTPEDVAGVVALLAAPEAAWINGTVIRVDGGEHISG